MSLTRRALANLPLAGLWALPLLAGFLFFLVAAGDPSAWQALFAHPQLAGAALHSLATAMASTVLALVAALAIIVAVHGSALWRRLLTLSGAAMALPHLAFAIGFGFLVMPSGVLARLIVGGASPPAWVTTQDPWGIELTLVLALKETPFLTALIWGLLSRGDWASQLIQEMRVAASLGHGRGSVWLRVVLPQLLPRLGWPLLAVFAYGASVVDMALVAGPTQPPTLAVVVWRDLASAKPGITSRGDAGALFLALLIAASGSMAWCLHRLGRRPWLHWASAGPSLLRLPSMPGTVLLVLMIVIYSLVSVVLLMMSLAARWPYPEFVPEDWRLAAWSSLGTALPPVMLSLGLACGTSLTGTALAAVWFETMPARHDRLLLALAAAALTLPALATAAGLYRLQLALGLAGNLAGLFVAHLIPVTAYAMIVLTGPYRAFDQRLWAVARGLNCSPLRFILAIKAPLLKAPLLAALAIGFSVSLVQFEIAQIVAAGRFSTLPMEAVTLASGGDRALTAAYALALALPQAAAFALAGWLSRPRWRMA